MTVSPQVHRATSPKILLLKDNLKYMYKENEDKARAETRSH